MELKELRWVGICTPNLSQAVDYYTGVLGMTVRNRGFIPGDPIDCEYVEMIMPNGDVLELFDHNLPERELFKRPVSVWSVPGTHFCRVGMSIDRSRFLDVRHRGSHSGFLYFLQRLWVCC